MDEDAHELQYVSASGLAAPPDGYDKITVSCPTTTGFTLPFTSVNSLPTVMQTGKGGGGGGSRGGGGGSSIVVNMSGKTAIADFVSVFNALAGTSGAKLIAKYYYISSAGSKPWSVYAIATSGYVSGANPAAPWPSTIMTMSGQASPASDSESLAIAAPSTTTLNADGFTQIGVPLNLSAY